MSRRERHQSEEPWERHVRRTLLPKIDQSAAFLSLLPEGEPDAKSCVELGAAIFYNKPIALLVLKGRTVPPGVRRIAHLVIENVDPDDPADQRRVAERMARFVEEWAPE